MQVFIHRNARSLIELFKFLKLVDRKALNKYQTLILILITLFSISVISCEEGKALAESWNAAFMESSAKENQVTHCLQHTRALFLSRSVM